MIDIDRQPVWCQTLEGQENTGFYPIYKSLIAGHAPVNRDFTWGSRWGSDNNPVVPTTSNLVSITP